MAEEIQSVIEADKLFQLGIVVRDLQKSMQLYQDMLGIGPWQTFETGPMLTSLSYKGRPVTNGNFAVGLAMSGNTQLELIQPLSGDLPYFEFLEQHGEGSHHTGHVYVPDLKAAVKNLEEQGYPCIFEGSTARTNFAYVDMTKSMGIILEMVEAPVQK